MTLSVAEALERDAALERIAELEFENALLREELKEQWRSNHGEQCSWTWPHPPGEWCHLPPPAILGYGSGARLYPGEADRDAAWLERRTSGGHTIVPAQLR